MAELIFVCGKRFIVFYMHAQLKDTIERVKAVDHAASIVDGILKQGQHATLNTGLVSSL